MAYPTNPSSPTDLLTALPAKFDEARQSGQLFFFPSQARDIYSNGKRFNIRQCPALLDKNKAKAEQLAAIRKDGSPDPKRQRTNGTRDDHQVDGQDQEDKGPHQHLDNQNAAEPFKPPYVPELYLGCLDGLEGEPGMSILLNKYALLPEHMLLCPASFQPQSLPPTPHQLALAFFILVAAARHPVKPRKLLAFYNGGEGAGASQSWRHLQFIELKDKAPVEEWTDGVKFVKQDEAVVHPDLTHLHIIHPLNDLKSIPYPPSPDHTEKLIDEIAPAFMKCLDIAIDAVRRGEGDKNGGWNLLMTLDHIHLIPRSSPTFSLPSAELLELNSLGYAGLILVRSEDEEKALLQAVEGEGGLMSMLGKCGVPRQWGEQAVQALTAHMGGSGELA